jgi:hypothetical protein
MWALSRNLSGGAEGRYKKCFGMADYLRDLNQEDGNEVTSIEMFSARTHNVYIRFKDRKRSISEKTTLTR